MIIDYRNYPASMPKDYIAGDLSEYVSAKEIDEGGYGLSRPIKWYSEVMEDEQSAETFLEEHATDDMDPIAVRYFLPLKEGHSKKLDRLNERRDKAFKQYCDMAHNGYFEHRKEKFVTCKRCGSKLNIKELGNRNICPVCWNDIRPDSVKQKEKDLDALVQKLDEDIRAEKLRLSQHAEKEKRWLVRFGYHT